MNYTVREALLLFFFIRRISAYNERNTVEVSVEGRGYDYLLIQDHES